MNDTPHDLTHSILQGNIRNVLDHVDFDGRPVEFVLVMFASGSGDIEGVNILADPHLATHRVIEALQRAALQAKQLSGL
jgi:hypothetical protein